MDIILSKEIKCMIKEEHLEPGDRLPSERILAQRFGVQRMTIRSALQLLLGPDHSFKALQRILRGSWKDFPVCQGK